MGNDQENYIQLDLLRSKFLSMLLFLLKETKTTSNKETNLHKVIVPSPSISTAICVCYSTGGTAVFSSAAGTDPITSNGTTEQRDTEFSMLKYAF